MHKVVCHLWLKIHRLCPIIWSWHTVSTLASLKDLAQNISKTQRKKHVKTVRVVLPLTSERMSGHVICSRGLMPTWMTQWFLANLYWSPKDTLCIPKNAKGPEQALIYDLPGMRNRISISLTLRDVLCCQVCRYWLEFWKGVIVWGGVVGGQEFFFF